MTKRTKRTTTGSKRATPVIVTVSDEKLKDIKSVASQLAAKGMKVEVVGADHQNKPDVGSNVVRTWIDVDKVDVVVDVPTSSVALAVNEVVREVLAEELERLSDADERIGLLTVTAVKVDPDLRHATVLLASISESAREALDEDRVRLQAAIGRQLRMKRTPQLSFRVDPAITSGTRIEDILRGLRGEADE